LIAIGEPLFCEVLHIKINQTIIITLTSSDYTSRQNIETDQIFRSESVKGGHFHHISKEKVFRLSHKESARKCLFSLVLVMIEGKATGEISIPDNDADCVVPIIRKRSMEEPETGVGKKTEMKLFKLQRSKFVRVQ
jgi:hypothetical protein